MMSSKDPGEDKPPFKDELLEKSFFGTEGKRRKKIKKAVLLVTGNDGPFAECFVSTVPRVLAVIKGTIKVKLYDLVLEACYLHNVLGNSSKALSTFKETKTQLFISKYAVKGFSLAPQCLPDFSELVLHDRGGNVRPICSPQGWNQTWFQFQRQDLHTVLAHCRKVPDHHHDHTHITRSLILAVSMANFYLLHKQPRFEPGDTRGKDDKDTRIGADPVSNNRLRVSALDNMIAPRRTRSTSARSSSA